MEYDYIRQGDSALLMADLPDESIDLTVTSPPYDNLRNYNGYTFDFEKIAKQLFRVTKEGGAVVWIVNDATVNGSETGTSFRQALCFMDTGFKLLDTMIWVKTGGGSCGSNYCYTQNTEYMFVFTKGRPNHVNLLRDRKNISEGQTRTGHGRRLPNGEINNEGGRTRSVPAFGKRYNYWYYPRMRGYGDHPAAFPEQLANDHILSWSNEGDVILDPFVGSGTTAKMALLNNRHYIGFDISQEYVDIAKQRIYETIHDMD